MILSCPPLRYPEQTAKIFLFQPIAQSRKSLASSLKVAGLYREVCHLGILEIPRPRIFRRNEYGVSGFGGQLRNEQEGQPFLLGQHEGSDHPGLQFERNIAKNHRVHAWDACTIRRWVRAKGKSGI